MGEIAYKNHCRQGSGDHSHYIEGFKKNPEKFLSEIGKEEPGRHEHMHH